MTLNSEERIKFGFLASGIADVIFGKYIHGKRALGIQDPEFVNLINSLIVCLTCAMLCHTLRAWHACVYQDPPDFKPDAVGGQIPLIGSDFV